MAVESTTVDQLSALLSQQLQAMAEERQEARERKARLTELLLQLTPTNRYHTAGDEAQPAVLQPTCNQPATVISDAGTTPLLRCVTPRILVVER